jgi:futalosine hydrolase
LEVAPLVAALRPAGARGPRVEAFQHPRHSIDILATGVGMVATAAWCGRTFSGDRYDMALNLGVCGSFDRALGLGTPVHVVSDCLAELGAEDGDGFLSVHDLGLLERDEFPFRGGHLVNDAAPPNAALARLATVRGITVNTVHGRESSIVGVVDRLAPQVESMEGAAFMYASLIAGVPFAQVRTVSNVVERRNREAWRMPAAVDALGTTALAILGSA